MDGPNLGGWSGLAVAVLAVSWGLVAGGCHSNTPGGHPFDGGSPDLVPDLVERAAPTPDADCPADAMGGGGFCPINFCGQVKSVAALAVGEVADTGADALCTPGYACVPDAPTADGTALRLRCVAPATGAAAFGADCVTSGTAGAHCAADTLCIQAASAPGTPFCSALCRSDGDCPAHAACLEYPSATLPNGSHANLGMCTPAAKLAPGGVTVCAREADCPAPQGCVLYGPRTNLTVCKDTGGVKSLGTACAGPGECRSGTCLDHDGHFSGGQNRAACAGICGKNSDCGADQRCVRLVLSNNDTPSDPRDDVVSGFCQTLFAPLASSGCHADADCVARADGSTTCDVRYGQCYKAGAAIGAACAVDAACDLGAVCTTGPRYPGGYCQSPGCDAAATTGVDACPGARSVCAQRGTDAPVSFCYEGCAQTGDCSRFSSAGYICDAAQGGVLVCVGGGGN
jgi:hypothetical protein